MSFEDAMKRLESALDGAVVQAKSLEGRSHVRFKTDLNALARAIEARITPTVRSMIQANFAKTRIGDPHQGQDEFARSSYQSTGKLAEAVKRCVVRVQFYTNISGKRNVAVDEQGVVQKYNKRTGQWKSTGEGVYIVKGRIHVEMPPDCGNYKDGSSLYTVSSALNYGALRIPKILRPKNDMAGYQQGPEEMLPIIGQKARKTLKKYMMGGQMSKRQASSMEKGRKWRKGKLAGEKIVGGARWNPATRQWSQGGRMVTMELKSAIEGAQGTRRGFAYHGAMTAAMTKPRPFFALNQSQRDVLLKMSEDVAREFQAQQESAA